MKDLQQQLKEDLGQVSEARNYPYRANLMTNDGEHINVTITLDNASDAKVMDKWLEEQLDNTIMHADGGPNDIEL